jgi:hypothetical protein
VVLVGVALLVLGVFAFVAAVVVSRRTPVPAQTGEPPQPGDGDVPWLPAVKIGSLVLAIIGLLMIIFG